MQKLEEIKHESDLRKISPCFKVKASPKKLSRNQNNIIPGIPSAMQELYHEFFAEIISGVHEKMPSFTNKKDASYDNYMTFPAGRSGVQYSVEFRGYHFACELLIDTGDKIKNEEIFEGLAGYKNEIEKQLGELSWEKLDNKRGCRIAIYTDTDTHEVDQLIEWAISNLEAFRCTFSAFLSLLQICTRLSAQ